MNAYMSKILETVKRRNAGDPEFIQAVEEVFSSLEVVIDKHPEYENIDLLGRLVEPERQIAFRVTWVDDEGITRVNRGYRVQFNSAIGPYKGGLRFHNSVYIGILKALGFEQTFKNALTGLPIGGAKGGSDFDPRGKSDNEIMRFCQAFMTELYRHIGPDIDVPAGDIGVGGREIGYLYGQYKRIKGVWENGVLTGNGTTYGGSLIRPEATGFGGVYFCNEVLQHQNDGGVAGKTFALSGYGNVCWGAATKINQLGGKVVTISGSEGYIYDEDGISGEKVDYLLELRESRNGRIRDFADKYPSAKFFPGEKPWGVKADIVMPCATQNEIQLEDAKKIVANNVKYVVELSNIPTTNEALAYLMENGVTVAPAKAANAGGVAVSALEMAQNSARLSWTAEEVDAKLHRIMKEIHANSAAAAEQYGLGYNLVAGANIAGFNKVARAMIEQGIF